MSGEENTWIDIIGALGPIILSAVAILITVWYSRLSQRLSKATMMKELFTEFNSRYDAINDRLNDVAKLSAEEWSALSDDDNSDAQGIIIDFFNICAEEYYWYKEGILNEKIWSAWSSGMNTIFNNSPVIQNLWDQECTDIGHERYYISKKNEIFKKAK